MKKIIISGGVIMLCLAFALIATGCKSPGEKLAEKATEKMLETAGGEGTDVDIDSETGEMTIKSGDTEITSSAKLPSDWPSDVPTYTGATISGSFSSSSEGQFGGWITLATSDSADKVKTWYADSLSQEGWTEESNFSSSSDGVDSTLVSYTKSERNLLISIGQDSSDENLTTVTLTVDKK